MKKLLKARKKNNKGFSLVELIVVIAIMAVLVGILAPQFIKYVDKSKKSTDIKNGQEIATAISASIAAGDTGYTSDVTTATAVSALTNKPSSMGTWPTIKSKTAAGTDWYVTFSATTGDVKVYVTTAATSAAATNMVYPTAGTDFTN